MDMKIKMEMSNKSTTGHNGNTKGMLLKMKMKIKSGIMKYENGIKYYKPQRKHTEDVTKMKNWKWEMRIQ